MSRKCLKILNDFSKLRIGYGYDVHKFIKNRKLIIGGIELKFKLGLDGHSDADVLIHAIIDALLGASSMGDIGTIFPNTDINFKNINSLILLKKTTELLYEKNFKIINIDSTIVAQEPKFLPHIEKMKINISKQCNIHNDNVNVKSTTEEYLGFTGNLEGIKASAVALVLKQN